MVCLVLVMLFPIGLFVGALTNLSVAVCGDGSNDIYWAWFCEGSDGAKVVKAILTGRPRLMQNAAAAECSLHAHGRGGGARGGGGGTRHRAAMALRSRLCCNEASPSCAAPAARSLSPSHHQRILGHVSSSRV